MVAVKDAGNKRARGPGFQVERASPRTACAGGMSRAEGIIPCKRGIAQLDGGIVIQVHGSTGGCITHGVIPVEFQGIPFQARPVRGHGDGASRRRAHAIGPGIQVRSVITGETAVAQGNGAKAGNGTAVLLGAVQTRFMEGDVIIGEIAPLDTHHGTCRPGKRASFSVCLGNHSVIGKGTSGKNQPGVLTVGDGAAGGRGKPAHGGIEIAGDGAVADFQCAAVVKRPAGENLGALLGGGDGVVASIQRQGSSLGDGDGTPVACYLCNGTVPAQVKYRFSDGLVLPVPNEVIPGNGAGSGCMGHGL